MCDFTAQEWRPINGLFKGRTLRLGYWNATKRDFAWCLDKPTQKMATISGYLKDVDTIDRFLRMGAKRFIVCDKALSGTHSIYVISSDDLNKYKEAKYFGDSWGQQFFVHIDHWAYVPEELGFS